MGRLLQSLDRHAMNTRPCSQSFLTEPPLSAKADDPSSYSLSCGGHGYINVAVVDGSSRSLKVSQDLVHHIVDRHPHAPIMSSPVVKLAPPDEDSATEAVVG
jgi:hypothetical protein